MEPDPTNTRIVATRWLTEPQIDGSTLLIVQDADGNQTEILLPYKAADFVSPIQKVKSDKTFSDLVDNTLPPVDRKAPFFNESEVPTKRHDPAWAIENLQKNPLPSKEDAGFSWLNQDPNPTRVDIPVFTDNPNVQIVDITGEMPVVTPDPTEGPQDEMGVDIAERIYEPTCQFSWPNPNASGELFYCRKSVHEDNLHDDGDHQYMA